MMESRREGRYTCRLHVFDEYVCLNVCACVYICVCICVCINIHVHVYVYVCVQRSNIHTVI